MTSRWRTKLQKLTEGRPEKSIQELVNEASDKGYDPILSEKLLNYIIEHIRISGIENFTIDFQDDIYNHYEMDEEDLSFEVENILRKHNIESPKRKEQKLFESTKNKYTVEYILDFVDWCRLRSLDGKK